MNSEDARKPYLTKILSYVMLSYISLTVPE